MHTQTPVHPVGFLLKAFVAWYTLDLSRNIVKAGRGGLAVVAAMVPFVFLGKTLLSPWKQIRDTAPKRGLNIERFAEALTLNVTARVIGMIVRIIAMLAGAVLAVAVVAATLSVLAVWVVLPVFFSGVLILAAIIV